MRHESIPIISRKVPFIKQHSTLNIRPRTVIGSSRRNTAPNIQKTYLGQKFQAGRKGQEGVDRLYNLRANMGAKKRVAKKRVTKSSGDRYSYIKREDMSRLERRLRDATQKIYSNDKRGPEAPTALGKQFDSRRRSFPSLSLARSSTPRAVFSRNRKGKFIKRRECFR